MSRGRTRDEDLFLLNRVKELEEQRQEIEAAWAGMIADLIAVKGHLDQPYPDDPRWTPWTRFIERGIRRMESALKEGK